MGAYVIWVVIDMRFLIINLGVLTGYIALVRVFQLCDVYEIMKIWFYGLLIFILGQSFLFVYLKRFVGFIFYFISVVLVFVILIPSGLAGYAIASTTGQSNKPTLRDPELVIVKTFALSYERGVMVGVMVDDSRYVKRIHGIPNDHITICDGEVFVNDFTYLHVNKWVGARFDNPLLCKREYRKLQLSEDEFFVLGDNINNSFDSRDFGPIKKSAIKLNYLFVLGRGDLRGSTSLKRSFTLPHSDE